MRLPIVALFCATPLLLHLAVVHESRLLMAAFLALVIAGMAMASIPRARLVLVACCAAAALWLAPAALGRIAPAGPALVFATLAWVFGRTLRGGRMPLVERISRVERAGAFPEGLRGYTRGLTIVWTALLTAVPAGYAALAALGHAEAASFVVNVASYVLVTALFFGEYAWRRLRYPQYPHVNPLAVARDLARRAPELLRERA